MKVGRKKGTVPICAKHPSGRSGKWGLSPFSRSGISLLEVLISLGVLSVGLLGVAALIPLGAISLQETTKLDYTGACGRSALREVQTRRANSAYPMLDYRAWWPTTAGTATPCVIAIDPLGYNQNTNPLGGVNMVPRLSLNVGGAQMTPAQAEAVFRWRDDLVFARPEDIQNTTLPAGGRPQTSTGGLPDHVGNFSWFVTIAPQRNEMGLRIDQRRLCSVSVVVCQGREFGLDSGTPRGEHVTSQAVQFLGGIEYGGGTIQLDAADAEIVGHLRTDQWVLLVGLNTAGTAVEVGHWYRVVGFGDRTTPTISLVGPNWDSTAYTQARTRLIEVHGVTGVYTSTMQLDNDLIWSR